MFENCRPNLNMLNWVEPPFQPEIDLNFLGLNAKVVITFFKEKKEG